jgi:hypothetical protein
MRDALRIPGFSWLRRRHGLFCCSGFECLVEAAGYDGFSALVVQDLDIRFEIHFSSLSEPEYEEYIRVPTASSYKGNIKLAGAFIASYCPYCGTRLASLVKPSNRGAFLRLAEKHKPFSLMAGQ